MENKKWRNIYIYILISLIALTVIIIFVELIILDNYKKNDISYINIFISTISVIATTVLSVLLYLTNLRSNKINENVVIMTQQQNYTQNYLMLMEKKRKAYQYIMSIEKYIECIKVLTLFCYINLDTYNKLQVLRKYKINPNQTELIKIINNDSIKLPKLSISEETRLKLNYHDPEDIKYKNIENQFSNLLPNSVFFQYNIKFLKEKVVNLSNITNDELISMYIEHIIIRDIMNLLKLKFFDEILNIDDQFSFSNTNFSSFKSSLILNNIEIVRNNLELIINDIKKEYEELESKINLI